ncbi:hypothetical protein VNI00_003065 [Paramarasmius palmivorus]|uniref:Uncharacterized protein n=1 Tax=Paramarasmius palmivorus TaxID=297713 RepID=A0AAW0DUG5_9AGAR
MSSPSPDTFTPRPEFLHPHKPPQPNSYALLTISGPNCIRLYSFLPSTLSTLRRFISQRGVLLATREDVPNNLYEFALDGKPWSTPKSLATERFLLDLLAVIYGCGYAYVSSVDYGRESDDRLAVVFSTPKADAGSKSTLAEKQVPFAVSFPSATLLRVIHPPLHSTPAILQAVRSSWPRGVESEKKVGDNCFEFKLKGYKWFQENTFATDSLRHILTLLTSLDAHSFTLQTSLSLSNRSRVKDLWIFTGPPSEDSTSPIPNSSSPSLQRTSPEPILPPALTHAHKKQATEPIPPHEQLSAPSSFRHPNTGQHNRAVTDPQHPPPLPPRSGSPNANANARPHTPPNVLRRKAAPRAQVPVSVHDEDPVEGGQQEYRAVLPSVISDSAQNMTGVGVGGGGGAVEGGRTPDVFYTSSPFGAGTPPRSRAATPQAASRGASPAPFPTQAQDPEPEQDVPSRDTGRLLSPGAFKDSGVYRYTDSAYEEAKDENDDEEGVKIPIQWTGGLPPPPAEERPPNPERMSSVPMLPGGWQSTPETEHPPPPAPERRDTEVHDVDVRVASPEVMRNEEAGQRQSEAALVGVIPSAPSSPAPIASPSPALPSSPHTDNKARQVSGASSGQGWVLVNVEGKSTPTSPVSPAKEPSSSSSGSGSDPHDTNPLHKPTSQNASMSPAAKAIVIIDAVGQKEKDKDKDTPRSNSRVKRFLSLSRKPGEEEKERERKGSIRDRLRRLGTPEVKRNEDNRRSFD